MENKIRSSKNNPFLTSEPSSNNGSGTATIVKPTIIMPLSKNCGSPGRTTRDRNVFITPPASAAMSLPLLRGGIFWLF